MDEAAYFEANDWCLAWGARHPELWERVKRRAGLVTVYEMRDILRRIDEVLGLG